MPIDFSQRILARNRAWWARGDPRELPHRLAESRAWLRRNDPDSAWHCCAKWPRLLAHKWNAREFAARHGAELPPLIWHGGPAAAVPVESLPEAFVVRPVYGAGRHGVLAVSAGREMLRDEDATSGALRARLARGRRGRQPLLIEEFVRREDGTAGLPLEVKFHTFAGHVGAIEVLERDSIRARTRRFYTPAWEPWSDRGYMSLEVAPPRDPPAGLEDALAVARAAGAELGTYMRIDFFASTGRCVFNEFSTTPLMGYGYSAYCNRVFGALWEERCPDAI